MWQLQATGALAYFGGPHHRHHAGGLLLVVRLHRLVAQIFEIVGEIVDLRRGPTLAHVNAAIELRQLRQWRALPEHEAFLRGPPARHGHDTETGLHRRREAHQAARGVDELAGATGLPYRRNRNTLRGTVLAVADQRYRALRIDAGGGARNPHRFAHPGMSGLDGRGWCLG